MESYKQIRENAEKEVRTKEKVIRNVSENCKNALLEKFLENDKTNFKCNFENDLKFLRRKNMHKIVVGQINIKSIRNKFDPLTAAVAGNIDILLITETKMDSTFPLKQFYVNGYNVPYRHDRNTNGGGILVCVRDDIRPRIIECENLPSSFEGLAIEISFNLKKWLLICSYNPHRNSIKEHVRVLSFCIDQNIQKYENVILIGDYIAEVTETSMQELCESYFLENMVKKPTCFKNPAKSTCIDLIITNKPGMFQNAKTCETGLSDFHRLVVSIMKLYKKRPPRRIKYRDYTNFLNEHFETCLNENLANNTELDYNSFEEPFKLRMVRANQRVFMNKKIHKTIMVGSRLRNKFLKEKTVFSREACNKQRNYCFKLTRESKIKNFDNLNVENIIDHKKFWKNFSSKKPINENISLWEKNRLITDEKSIAKVFNDYFTSITKHLHLKRNEFDLKHLKLSNNPVLSAASKFQNHASILKIKSNRTYSDFTFRPANF